ncbi:hypothetical protein GCM10017788_58980 [Amycolatopsis acidiphila]|nr:hypothetical protein GCM10017788_58980 [Amycolatopsis acidiphila]
MSSWKGGSSGVEEVLDSLVVVGLLESVVRVEVDVVLLAPVVLLAELVGSVGAEAPLEVDSGAVVTTSLVLVSEVGVAGDEVSSANAAGAAKVIRAPAASTAARRPTDLCKVCSRKSLGARRPHGRDAESPHRHSFE